MTYAGAKSNTATELKELLGLSNFKSDQDIFNSIKTILSKLNNLSTDSVSLITANKIFPNNKFNVSKAYVNLIKSNFNNDVQQLNFADNKQSAKIINDWVSEKTKKKINNAISQSESIIIPPEVSVSSHVIGLKVNKSKSNKRIKF